MHSPHNEGKSAAAEIVRTLKKNLQIYDISIKKYGY